MNLPNIGENHSSHASNYIRFGKMLRLSLMTDMRRLPPACSGITEQTGISGG